MSYWKNIVFILVFSTSISFAQNYLWPTDASRLITSSFGEFRPRHFHAAVDIKTWGQIGYKIFAIEEGYIYRIRVSSKGYGRAIYLKLNDGNIVVYGHLNRFIPQLEDYTDSLRLAAKNNTLDTFPKPGQFPVKKAQLLGYTGDTGIGVPHLHFEIRDSKNRPINPLQFFHRTIHDDKPPLPQTMAIIPLSAITLVNFQPDTLMVNLPLHEKVTLSQPIYLTGKAYIAVKSYDRANGAGNRFSFYRAHLFVNDSLIYQVKYDRFSYAETHLVELDKNYSLWRKGLGTFHNFYRHRFNSLSFYGDSNYKSGILSGNNLNEGLNRIRLELFDFDGNHSEIEFNIVYHNKEQIKVFDLSRLSDKILMGLKSNTPIKKLDVKFLTSDLLNQRALTNVQFKLLNGFMDNFYYSLTLPFPHNPEYSMIQINSYDNNQIPLLPCYMSLNESTTDTTTSIDVLGTRFSGDMLAILTNDASQVFSKFGIEPAFAFQPDPYSNYSVINVDTFKNNLGKNAVSEILAHGHSPGQRRGERGLNDIHNWIQISPGKTVSVYSPDNFLRIDFPADAAYDTFFCRIVSDSSPQNIPIDYPVMSPVYNVQPFDQVLNRGAILNFSVSDSIKNDDGLAIYYWDTKKGWLFLPTDFRNHTYRTRITSLEKFVAVKDSIPPGIAPVNQLYAEKIYIQNRPLKFSVRDVMAGIYNQEQISVYIGEQWTLFRYDPEEDLIMIYPKHVPTGEHQLTITAADNVGNQTIKEYIILKQ